MYEIIFIISLLAMLTAVALNIYLWSSRYFQKRKGWERLEELSKEIKKACDEAGVDLEEEFEKARSEAWEDYKKKYYRFDNKS